MALTVFAAGQERRRRAASGLLQVVAAAAVVACISQASQSTFVPASTRRMALLGGALPVLLGQQRADAIPRVTDRAVYINSQKVELVPVFKQGLDYLEKFGVDERMTLFMPRMVRKMKIYATCFSASEAPDKKVKTLEKDAEAFEKAINAKDKDAAIAAFAQYQADVPKGVGTFDIKKPGTFEAPEP
uniref:Uncharacterized protein n=1 Tax=Alexandrium andersonii TaxID=327968 RepID=A0A7S2HCE7_9DINO